ncbi:MAG: hypothetical protein F7C08_02575 [Desulfurococcales archaeon]|nr:hypothetical protein [Desulfurococcales archaeon]MCE4605402.1 hypothetical protein [Desulfurococcales archaeon]
MARLSVAHTPDPDDAFMFYGIVSGAVRVVGFDGVDHIIEDIETLNRWIIEEGRAIDATAASAHAYAYVSNRYYLLRTGASMGEGYGPVVVSKPGLASLRGARVAVPGRYTTAYLLLRLAIGDIFQPVFTRFDLVPGMVESGEADAGLLIHEEQITYASRGLDLVLDLWEWWSRETGGLPMPLGVDLFSMSHGRDAAEAFRRALVESIRYSYEHKGEAISFASRYSRVKDLSLLEKFITMYVNDRTIDMGEDGLEAHRVLYRMSRDRGLLPEVRMEVV